MRQILEQDEYAAICLNCPRQTCEMDYWGECDRTKPYKPKYKEQYASSKEPEIE